MSKKRAAPKGGPSQSASGKKATTAKRTEQRHGKDPKFVPSGEAGLVRFTCSKLDHLLAGSCISADVAKARGYRTVRSPMEMVKLGFARSQCLVPAIVVPIYSVGPGAEVVLHQMRPYEPRDEKHKYETPAGRGNRLDCPPTVNHLLRDTNADLYITEGARKADALASEGACAISLCGVDAWSASSAPLNDWRHVSLDNRVVHVVYDSDVMRKPSVGAALERITMFLRSEGAQVRWVILPELPGLDKTGVDDFLAAGNELSDVRALARDPEDVVAEPSSMEVAKELRRVRARQRAKNMHEQLEAARNLVIPPSRLTLADELALPDDELRFSIEQLHPEGANTLLSAQFKSGKTTLLINLLRAAVDGEPFLERFATSFPPGRVAFWNYELGELQFRKWLRDNRIEQTDRASVWNLRGYRVPLASRIGEDIAVDWLVEREVSTLILDPYARAYGGAENDNLETNLFLEAIDVIKRRAKVSNVFMAAHFGREQFAIGKEHARGATRLDDWADVRWILTEEHGPRYFRANGRDVDVSEGALAFDKATRRLRLTDGDRKSTRRDARVTDNLQKLRAVVADNEGITSSDLQDVCGFNKNNLAEVVRIAKERRVIRVEKGPNNSNLHFTASRPKLTSVPND